MAEEDYSYYPYQDSRDYHIDIGNLVRRLRLQDIFGPTPPLPKPIVQSEFPPPQQPQDIPPQIPRGNVAPMQGPVPTTRAIQPQAPRQPQMQASMQIGEQPPQQQLPSINPMPSPAPTVQPMSAARSPQQPQDEYPIPQSIQDWEAARRAPGPDYNDPRLQTHGWKKFANVLEGIGEGALFRNPMLGKDVYEQAHRAPYYRAVASQQADVDRLAEIANVDLAAREAKMKGRLQSTTELKNVAEAERAESEGIKARAEAAGMPPDYATKIADEIKKYQMEHPKEILYGRFKGKPNFVPLVQDPQTGKLYQQGNPTPIDPNQLVGPPVKAGTERNLTPEQQALEAAEMEKNQGKPPEQWQPLTTKEIEDINKTFKERAVDPTVAATHRLLLEQRLKDVRDRQNEVSTEINALIMNPNAKTLSGVNPKIREEVRAGYMKKTGLPPPAGVDRATENRVAAAKATQGMARDIDEYVEAHPRLKPHIGMAWGYLDEWAYKLGASVTIPQEDKQDFATLVSMLRTLKTNEAISASGGARGKYTQEQFDHYAPTVHDNWDTFKGKLNGIHRMAQIPIDDGVIMSQGEAAVIKLPGGIEFPAIQERKGQMVQYNRKTGKFEPINMESIE